MKTKEELNALKEEIETVNSKLRELTNKELEDRGTVLLPWRHWVPLGTVLIDNNPRQKNRPLVFRNVYRKEPRGT